MRPTLIINGQPVRYRSFALDASLLTVTRRPSAERTSAERWRVLKVRLYQDPLPLAGVRRPRPRLHVDAESVVDSVQRVRAAAAELRYGIGITKSFVESFGLPSELADQAIANRLQIASRQLQDRIWREMLERDREIARPQFDDWMVAKRFEMSYTPPASIVEAAVRAESERFLARLRDAGLRGADAGVVLALQEPPGFLSPIAPGPAPAIATPPPFPATIDGAVEFYRTLAYDAERAGDLARAEQLRAVARSVADLDQRGFIRWYATTDHPRDV